MNINDFVQKESQDKEYGIFIKGQLVTARKTSKGGMMLTVNNGCGTSQIYLKQDQMNAMSITPDGEICCKVEVSRDAFIGYLEDVVF